MTLSTPTPQAQAQAQTYFENPANFAVCGRVSDWFDASKRLPETVYLKTAWGFTRIGRIDPETLGIHCPDDNGGFGMEYAGHAGKALYAEKPEARKRRELASLDKRFARLNRELGVEIEHVLIVDQHWQDREGFEVTDSEGRLLGCFYETPEGGFVTIRERDIRNARKDGAKFRAYVSEATTFNGAAWFIAHCELESAR